MNILQNFVHIKSNPSPFEFISEIIFKWILVNKRRLSIDFYKYVNTFIEALKDFNGDYFIENINICFKTIQSINENHEERSVEL